MRIGELAARSGVSTSAIRFYEARGLLPAARRSSNGYRDYPETALAQLSLILLGQRLGFSLETIRSGLTESGEKRHRLILEGLQARLADIGRMRALLAAQEEKIHAMIAALQARWAAGDCASVEDLPGVSEIQTFMEPRPDAGCDVEGGSGDGSEAAGTVAGIGSQAAMPPLRRRR